MRHTRMTIAVLISTAMVAAAAPARSVQKPPVQADQRYLLLATQRTGTMQMELKEAAAQGFKVLAGSPTSGTEMVLFLERVTQPPETYTYRLLATTRTSTMEKELNDAAAEGFRLLPQTAIAQSSAGRRILGGGFAGNEIVVVVERAPKVERRYEYQLLATSRTGTMQKEVAEAVASGWILVTLLSRDEHMVVMERQREPRAVVISERPDSGSRGPSAPQANIDR